MRISRLSDFTRGWFIGSFQPTLCDTEAVEVGVKHYPAGAREAAHYHRVATEHTLILDGTVRMQGRVVNAGEIVTIAPDEVTDFEALTAVTTVVIKLPGARNDKYLP